MLKKLRRGALLMVTALSTVVAPRESRAQQTAVIVTTNVMIPMRDGVKMATDLYRPARNGVAIEDKLPILLHRTPYGKEGMKKDAEYFAAHGYVVAVQDIRGRHGSEGKFEKYDDLNATDGVDIIE